MLPVLQAFIYVVYIVLWGYILSYIVKLEKTGCPCSKDWRREFIKYYLVFMLLLIILRMFEMYSPTSMPPILMTLQFVLSVGFVMVVYHYIHDLKQKKCACSESMARDILEIVNYIQVFLVVVSLVMMIHVMFTIAYVYKRSESLRSAMRRLSKSAMKHVSKASPK